MSSISSASSARSLVNAYGDCCIRVFVYCQIHRVSVDEMLTGYLVPVDLMTSMKWLR